MSDKDRTQLKLCTVAPVVVKVMWHIRKGKEQDFIKKWESLRVLGMDQGLLFEVLCQVPDPGQYPDGVTTGVTSDQKVTRYVNFGIWHSKRQFLEFPPVREAVANPDRAKWPCEHTMRQRTVLSPVSAQFETESLEGFLAALPLFMPGTLYLRNEQYGGLLRVTSHRIPGFEDADPEE